MTEYELFHASDETQSIIDNGFDEIKLPLFNDINSGKVSKGLGTFGVGVYAYEGVKSIDACRTFGNRKYGSNNYKILKFNADINDEKLLDLTSLEDAHYFYKFCENKKNVEYLKFLNKKYRNKGYAKIYQGICIEYYIFMMVSSNKMQNPEAIRGGSNNSEIYKKFIILNGIEMCIRNGNVIDKSSIRLYNN